MNDRAAQDSYVYHATFKSNLCSIKITGLEPGHERNWEGSKSVICFSTDPDVAHSYCECAEKVSDHKYDSGIVVLAVPKTVLVPALVGLDTNNLERAQSFEYKGTIPPECLYICKSGIGIFGRLLEVKRIPLYEGSE